jgi:hypothetical protein
MDPPKWQSSGKAFTLNPGAAQEVVGASPTRRALIVSSDGAGGAFVGVAMQVNAALQFGITLTTSQPFVEITYEKYGSIVQQPWLGRAATGAVTLSVIEVMET